MSTPPGSSSILRAPATTSRTGIRSTGTASSSRAVNGSIGAASRSGLKRDRETFSSEHERDSILPSTKRHFLSTTLSSSVSERQLASLQTTRAELEKQVREKDQKIDLLEKDRRWLHDRETEEREGREKIEKEAREKEARLTQSLSALQIAHSDLQLSHEDLRETHATLERTRSHESSILKARLDALQKQVAFLEGRVEEEKNAAKTAALLSSSTSGHGLSSSMSESSLSKSTSSFPEADHKVLTAELKRQATYLRQLESANTRLSGDVVVLKNENSTLRQHNATVEVLREEKRGLESRLRIKESEIEKLVRKEEELRRSHRRSSGRPELPLSPATLATHLGLDQDESEDSAMEGDRRPTIKETSELADLRLKHATLLDAHGTAMAELSALKREVAALREGQTESKPSISERDPESQDDRYEVTNLRIRLRMKNEELQTALRELAFAEALAARLTSDSQTQPPEANPTASMQEARVQHLEALLNDANRTNTELRSEVEGLLSRVERTRARESEVEKKAMQRVKEAQDKAREAVEGSEKKLQFATEALNTEKKAKEELEKALDNVEQELFELRGEVAGGRHVPPNTRILVMKENPQAEWEASRAVALERLRGENQALLKRLGEVEGAFKEAEDAKAKATAGAGPSSGQAAADRSTEGPTDNESTLVPRESLDLALQEKAELEEQIREREKRLLRLKEIFGVKSTEFREAIERLLGVKLAFFPNGQVRITSLYDLNASFIFRPDRDANSGTGDMQLVGTSDGGPQDVDELMRFWLEKEGSIPGFIASVTLEAYDASKKRPK